MPVRRPCLARGSYISYVSGRVCAVVVEGSCALQYFERSDLKVSEGLGMVMEMESGDSRILNFENSEMNLRYLTIN